ncbi:hypothetical protein [Paenibacillus allorhizoplanae]|uniref:hypothetical protein n=1 Tax=Paenibacillus allorhizoplanae TaxID=2905648 RepID=UPI001F26D524|nr:hypothetical protein [Paenibacillus allorhizoplanae]
MRRLTRMVGAEGEAVAEIDGFPPSIFVLNQPKHSIDGFPTANLTQSPPFAANGQI